MKIKIERKNYKQLVQCLYLGEMVINEFRNDDEQIVEYENFIKETLLQIINSLPNIESVLNLAPLSFKRTNDILLSDLKDRIFDSVAAYYDEYKKSVFCEILAEKIANINYPAHDEKSCVNNLLAKNLYYKILCNYDNNDFVCISAAKIDKQLDHIKKERNLT